MKPEGPKDPGTRNAVDNIVRQINRLTGIMLVLILLVFLRLSFPDLFQAGGETPTVAIAPTATEPADLEGVVNGIHVESGLVVGENWELVRTTCTACHSGKLVTQNRADREGWTKMIRWMQETQNLWDLGENEGPILDYLATYYAPQKKGRRARLTNIQWYDLEP